MRTQTHTHWDFKAIFVFYFLFFPSSRLLNDACAFVLWGENPREITIEKKKRKRKLQKCQIILNPHAKFYFFHLSLLKNVFKARQQFDVRDYYPFLFFRSLRPIIKRESENARKLKGQQNIDIDV
jgi:hypothetical protein